MAQCTQKNWDSARELQHSGLTYHMLASYICIVIWVTATTLPIHLPDAAHERAVEVAPSTWAFALTRETNVEFHVGGLGMDQPQPLELFRQWTGEQKISLSLSLFFSPIA